MMLAIMALTLVGLVVYWVLLAQLASALQAEKPAMYEAVGRPGSGDYIMAGLTVGDGYISKLEAKESELLDAPRTLRLMKAVRWAWASTLFLALGAFLVLFSHAT